MRPTPLLLSLALLLSAAAVCAEPQDRRAQDIVRSTMSPFCPGRTLATCPSPRAGEWRQDIDRWVAEGVPTEEIRRRLEARVDGDLSGQPSAPLGWLTPVLIVAGAAGVLVYVLRRLARNDSTGSDKKPGDTEGRGGTAAENARLDEELRDLDE
jgi:cytochrome c-type biogenesis protein CcmH/NrfF